MSETRQTEILENVFRQNRLKTSLKDNYLSKGAEYATAQSATEFIAAPGTGKRIVVKYVTIRTDASSGVMEFNGTYGGSAKVFGKVYVSNFSSFATGNISLPLDENTAVTITTTTGTSNVFAAIEYVIEDV